MIVAGLIQIAVSSLCALFLAIVFGHLTPVISGLSLLVGFIAAIRVYRLFKEEGLNLKGLNPIEWVLVVFIALVGLRHFAYLFFYGENTYKTLSPNNLGDLPLHISFIRHFAQGGVFFPRNPSYAIERLRYPYGMDLYNALWESVGVVTAGHLFVIGIFCLVAAVVCLRRWAGWLGIGAFFLNGGLAGYEVLRTGVLKDYQDPVAWKNFFLTMFVPQRGFLFAIPAGIYVFTALLEVIEGRRKYTSGQMTVIGLLWGSLAFFHLHTFFALSLLIGSIALARRAVWPVRNALYWAVPIGAFFVLYSTEFFGKAGAMHIKWGWMAENQSVWTFWFVNLGPWLVLLAVLPFLLYRKSQEEWRWPFVVYAGWFFVFTWLMLAPWEWDNLKVMIWPYFGLVAIAYHAVVKRLPLVAQASIAVILFFSGAVSIVGASGPQVTGTVVFPAKDLWYTQGAIKNVPINAVVACAPTYNHPLAYWGRKRVMGYEGHLWSHGINPTETVEKLNRIYAGDPSWLQMARELGVTHIFVGPDERALLKNGEPPWRRELVNVSNVPEYEVYEIRY